MFDKRHFDRHFAKFGKAIFHLQKIPIYINYIAKTVPKFARIQFPYIFNRLPLNIKKFKVEIDEKMYTFFKWPENFYILK